MHHIGTPNSKKKTAPACQRSRVKVVKNPFASHNRIEPMAKCANKNLTVRTNSHIYFCFNRRGKKVFIATETHTIARKLEQSRKKSNLNVTGAKTYALNVTKKKKTNNEKKSREISRKLNRVFFSPTHFLVCKI